MVNSLNESGILAKRDNPRNEEGPWTQFAEKRLKK
jgi:hypothetical protein